MNEPTPSNRRLPLFIATIAAALLMIGTGVWLAVDNKQDVTQRDTQISSAENKIVKVGEDIAFTTEKMRVNSFDVLNTFTTYGTTHNAPEGTKFLKVNLTVTNTQNTPHSYTDYSLLTDKGTLIKEDITIMAYGENSIKQSELNPNVPVSGYTIFVIPSDIKAVEIGATDLKTNAFYGVHLDLSI